MLAEGKLSITVILYGFILGFSTGGFFYFRCQPQKKAADLVLLNGKIVTVDEKIPQAQAVAIRGDMIIAVGSDRDVRSYIDEKTQVIDLQGKLAVPGFIEGHAHFIKLGYVKMRLDLKKARTWSEIVEMVREAARNASPGEWILGRGWHQEKWERTPVPNVEGYPTHEALSQVAPDNPVYLTHASGHASLVNARAMELAGITRSTPDPEGGEILRNRNGTPTGLLRETAQELIIHAIEESRRNRTPAQVEMEERKAIQLAIQECLSKGVTTFQDAGSSFRRIDLYKKLLMEGKLGMRLWVMIRESNEMLKKNLSKYRIINMGDKRLTVRAIKRVIDGALGTHTAWLLAPYTDLPNSTGINTAPIDDILETARLAIENGFQLCVHAIGDRANRETLNIYEKVFRENPDKKDLRWRIEHAQHLNVADIPRFAELGVIAAMQGVHCTSDGPWVIKRLGTRRAEEGAYVWRKLINSGVIIVNGTDAPVEDVNPLANFYASVTRKLTDGSLFYPDQKMTRQEALRSYTIYGAYAAFEDNIKGSITPGKLADITVLSQDIMTIPVEEILETEVVYTIVGGKIAYRRSEEK